MKNFLTSESFKDRTNIRKGVCVLFIIAERIVTSIALTRYCDKTDMKQVNINNHTIDSHFDITGTSSSELLSVGLSSWII